MEQRNSHRITRKVTLIKIYSADIQTLLIHRQKQAPPPAILQMVLLIIYDCYTRFIIFMRTSRILTCPFYNKTLLLTASGSSIALFLNLAQFSLMWQLPSLLHLADLEPAENAFSNWYDTGSCSV